jgi:hypothetical protein
MEFHRRSHTEGTISYPINFFIRFLACSANFFIQEEPINADSADPVNLSRAIVFSPTAPEDGQKDEQHDCAKMNNTTVTIEFDCHRRDMVNLKIGSPGSRGFSIFLLLLNVQVLVLSDYP